MEGLEGGKEDLQTPKRFGDSELRKGLCRFEDLWSADRSYDN